MVQRPKHTVRLFWEHEVVRRTCGFGEGRPGEVELYSTHKGTPPGSGPPAERPGAGWPGRASRAPTAEQQDGVT